MHGMRLLLEIPSNFIPSLLQGQFVIEEVLNEEHDHEVEVIPLKGLSREQKGIVLFCEDRRIGAPKSVESRS